MSSSDEEEMTLQDIPTIIKRIPSQFHSSKFAPRPVVLDIMRNSNVQRELHSLEDHCKSMDEAMNSVVNCIDFPLLA